MHCRGTGRFRLILAFLPVLLTGCGDGFKRDLSSVGHTVVNFASGRTQALNLMDALSDLDLILDGNLVAQLRGDLMLMANVSGGLVIYAANADNPALGGRRILTSPGQGSSVNWSIPNGNYVFYLVGWDAANMGGNIACGWANQGQPLRLDGGNHTITLNTFDCATDPFMGPETGGIVSGYTAVVACNSATDLTTQAAGSPCNGAADSSVYEFRLAIFQYDYFGEPSAPPLSAPALQSACTSVGTTQVFLDHVPGTMDYRFRIPMEILLYGNAVCGVTDVVYKGYHLAWGLGGADADLGLDASSQQIGCAPEEDRAQWFYESGVGDSYVYIRDDTCP